MITRKLEPREIKIINAFSITSPYTSGDIERAYRILRSYDKVESLIDISAESGIGFHRTLDYLR